MHIPDELAKELLESIRPLMRIDNYQQDYCGFCYGGYSTSTQSIVHKKDCCAIAFEEACYAAERDS